MPTAAVNVKQRARIEILRGQNRRRYKIAPLIKHQYREPNQWPRMRGIFTAKELNASEQFTDWLGWPFVAR